AWTRRGAMTYESLRIGDRDSYNAYTDFLQSAVNLRCKLPENPFCGTGLTYRFDEFDWALSGVFWETVRLLSSHSSDNEVLMAVLEPDPESYFKSNFGHYGWACLPVG